MIAGAAKIKINYEGRGSGDPNNNFLTTMDFLDITPLLKKRFGKNSIQGFVNVGPYVGFLLSDQSFIDVKLPLGMLI